MLKKQNSPNSLYSSIALYSTVLLLKPKNQNLSFCLLSCYSWSPSWAMAVSYASPIPQLYFQWTPLAIQLSTVVAKILVAAIKYLNRPSGFSSYSSGSTESSKVYIKSSYKTQYQSKLWAIEHCLCSSWGDAGRLYTFTKGMKIIIPSTVYIGTLTFYLQCW